VSSSGSRIHLPRAAVVLALAGAVAYLIVWVSGSHTQPAPGVSATRVQFEVKGSAAGRVAVQYGGNTIDPFSGSSDARLPFTAVERIDLHNDGYTVEAGLHRPGRITCEVRIGDVIDVGHAHGRGSFCNAELDYHLGWHPAAPPP
jgi:hypothetical protein